MRPGFQSQLSTPAQQEVAFTAQLALAAELALPVFLHCRDAHARFAELLTPWLDKPPAAVHCFTGTAEELTSCLSLGLSIGIGSGDERRGLELRALLPQIPAERLLLETDAPYLLPRIYNLNPHLAATNPVSFLPHIVHQVAVWRQEEPQWLGQNR